MIETLFHNAPATTGAFCFHNHAPEQLTRGLPFDQQAANEVGGNLLGGAGKEGLGKRLIAMSWRDYPTQQHGRKMNDLTSQKSSGTRAFKIAKQIITNHFRTLQIKPPRGTVYY